MDCFADEKEAQNPIFRAMHHVINRGNYRRDLFVSPGKAKAFLETELIDKQRTDSFSAPWDFEYTNASAGAFLTDSALRRMHDFGFAKEFLVSGSTKIKTVKWAQGSKRPDAASVVDEL